MVEFSTIFGRGTVQKRLRNGYMHGWETLERVELGGVNFQTHRTGCRRKLPAYTLDAGARQLLPGGPLHAKPDLQHRGEANARRKIIVFLKSDLL